MQSQWSSFALLLIFRFLGVAISWEAPLFMGARISQPELDNMAETARRMAKREGPAAMPVVNGCSACPKTYSESCPLNWERNEDEACIAPSGYSGYCAQGLNFDGWSVESKINAEMSCSMCWPCSDVSAPDEASDIE